MRYEHVDNVSLHTYIHTYIDTYIGTANLPYVTLVFGVRSGLPRINNDNDNGKDATDCFTLCICVVQYTSGCWLVHTVETGC